MGWGPPGCLIALLRRVTLRHAEPQRSTRLGTLHARRWDMTSWLCPSKVLYDQIFLWGPYGESLSTERGDAAVAARRGSGGSLCFPGTVFRRTGVGVATASRGACAEHFEKLMVMKCCLPASRVGALSKALNREGRVLFVCSMGKALPSSIGRSIGRLRMPKPEIPPLNLLGT